MSVRKGLTWSKKWHIVDEAKSHPNYDIAVCGAHLYNAEKERAKYRHGSMPDHLQRVINGDAKSTGDCKLCAKSSGVKTVSIELPQPWRNIGGSPVWNVSLDGGDESVYIGAKGGVTVSGYATFDERDIPALVGALLAAAAALEARS